MKSLDLNSLKITHETVDKTIEFFLNFDIEMDRSARNKVLQKLKKFHSQDVVLWERIGMFFDPKKAISAEQLVQFNVVLLIFLDNPFGIELAGKHSNSVWDCMKLQIPKLLDAFYNEDWDILDSKATHQFLKPLLGLLIKYPATYRLAESIVSKKTLFEIILIFLNPKLNIETRMLASIIAGTLLVSHSSERFSIHLSVLNQESAGVGAVSTVLQQFTESNPEGQILVIGGILQTNAQSIVDCLENSMDLDFMVSLFHRIVELIQSNADSRIQSFSVLAISRWYSVVVSLPDKRGLLEKLCSGAEISTSLELVLSRWEDPTISQQKLRELFGSICDLIISSSILKPQLEQTILTLTEIKDRKGKFDLLAILAPRICTGEVLKVSPSILDQAFQVLSKPSINSSAATFINQFIKKMSIDNLNLQTYGDLYVNGLLSDDALTRKLTSERLLPQLGRLDLQVFDKLIDTIRSNQPLDEPSYEAIISILKASKTIGMTLGFTKSPEYAEIIKVGISSCNSRIRFQTFCFIAESNQTSKDITSEEMSIVKSFLILNGGGETVDARQQITAQMGRFLERLKRCLYKNMREEIAIKKKLTVFTNKSDLLHGQMEEVKVMIHEKLEFFQWIKSFAVIRVDIDIWIVPWIIVRKDYIVRIVTFFTTRNRRTEG
jgi:hypothetical protein